MGQYFCVIFLVPGTLLSLSSSTSFHRFSDCLPVNMGDSILTVVGGRMVVTKASNPQSSHSSYPLTGQQLMMQVDSMTSSLMDMVVSGNSDTNNQQMETDTQHQQQQQQVMLHRQQEELLRQQEYQQQLMKMQNIRSMHPTCIQSHQKCILWD